MQEVNAAGFFSLLKRGKGCFSFWNLLPLSKPSWPRELGRLCPERWGAALHCCVPQAANVSLLNTSLLNTSKQGKKPIEFWLSWRVETAPPLQAPCSRAFPHALWESLSLTGIHPHSSSFHHVALRSAWPCLQLPRQQLSMSQPFPCCTSLDLTDPPLSPCSHLPTSPLVLQPQSKQRRKRAFPSACCCPGTQPGTWLPAGEHHWLMVTRAEPQGSPHSPFQPVHSAQATALGLSDLPSVQQVLNTLKLPGHLWSVCTFSMSSRKGRIGQIYKSVFTSIQLLYFSWKLYK